MASLSFAKNKTNFYQELTQRVYNYMKANRLKTYGNAALYWKAIFFLTSFLGLYSLLVFGNLPGILSILGCIALGIVTAGIGFNIMHDGSHGSFSKNATINKLASWTLNMVGGSSFFWNIKHNQIHHTFTNVHGHDEDIDTDPFIRMTELQEKKKLHKYQHIYSFGIYGFLYMTWIYFFDFKRYFERRILQKDNIHIDGKTHAGFWMTKVLYIFMFIGLPCFFMPFWKVIVGYLIFSMVTGIIISVIFQLAHAVEHVEFVHVDEGQTELDNDWAIHQVQTTSNFATKSKWVHFFTGGLNHQVEHHLFPKISHVYYPAINDIVRAVCAEYGIRYHEQPSLASAVASHYRFLKAMGN